MHVCVSVRARVCVCLLTRYGLDPVNLNLKASFTSDLCARTSEP